MEKSKENKGITLVALIVLIIVMAILITTAIYTGVGTVRYTRFMKIKTEMETLQASVNSWYEKYINGDESVLNYGETVNYSEYDEEFVYVLADEEAAQNYKLYTAEYIKNTLGIDGIEYDYLISIKDRMVVLVDGLIYQGKLYYIPDDFDLKNVEAHEPIFSVDFNLVCGRNPKDLKQEVIFIYGIKFYDNGREINMSKFDIEYSTDGINWTTVSSANSKTEYNGNTAYMIYTKDDGTYNVRIKDRNGNIITRTDNIEKSIEVVNCSFPSFNNNDWQIYSVRQLRFLAEFVNNAYTTVGNEKLTKVLANSGHVEAEIKELTESSWIYLMNDLDLGARPGPGTTEEDKWETAANESIKWEPIGVKADDSADNALKASFDGQNHIIKGVYVNRNKKFNGIFGYATSTIQNLTIKDSYIKGLRTVGGILGCLENGNIYNCHNNMTIVKVDNIGGGGILGATPNSTVRIKISNCTNSGMIKGDIIDTSLGNTIGGIAGQLRNCDISKCINYGNVFGEKRSVGGIAGQVTDNTKIKNCINNGEITGKCSGNGGIAGTLRTRSELEDCINKGKVVGTCEIPYNTLPTIGSTGGIVGHADPGIGIKGCVNYESVNGKKEGTGGIVGTLSVNITLEGSILTNCYNSGKVEGEKNTGGILGYTTDSTGYPNAKVTIINCYNKGTVTGTEVVGSVIGEPGGGNLINNLYYLSSLALGAINGVDDVTNNIRSTTDDFADLDSFLNALNAGNIN